MSEESPRQQKKRERAERRAVKDGEKSRQELRARREQHRADKNHRYEDDR